MSTYMSTYIMSTYNMSTYVMSTDVIYNIRNYDGKIIILWRTKIQENA